ncbi:MAG: hypothetical protein NUV31_11350, partial [Dehalococcoidales bacterium]|nr:hypothetical protein [Dehalococcoidales bacterium]
RTEPPNTLEYINNHLEDIYAEYVAAKALINKSSKYINSIAVGSSNAFVNYANSGNSRMAMVIAQLRKMVRRQPTYYVLSTT